MASEPEDQLSRRLPDRGATLPPEDGREPPLAALREPPAPREPLLTAPREPPLLRGVALGALRVAVRCNAACRSFGQYAAIVHTCQPGPSRAPRASGRRRRAPPDTTEE